MPSTRSAALSKLNSLKITTMNAITELEMRAEAAHARGDTAAEDANISEAIALAQASIHIRKTEDKIRASMPLTTTIELLDDIATDGRKTLAVMRQAVDALSSATKLLQILARLVPLV